MATRRRAGGGVARHSLHGSPPSLSVSFRQTSSSGCATPEIVDAIRGKYDRAGENHGKPVYRRRPHTPTEEEVCVYFWDDIDDVSENGTSEPGSWWFGCKIGENKVWAWSPSSDALPPERGWEIGGGLSGSLELVVALDRAPVLPQESRAPRAALAQPVAERRGPAAVVQSRIAGICRSLDQDPAGSARTRPAARLALPARPVFRQRSDSRCLQRRSPATRGSQATRRRSRSRGRADQLGEARLLRAGAGNLEGRPRFVLYNRARRRSSRSLSSRRWSRSVSPRPEPRRRAHLRHAVNGRSESEPEEEHSPGGRLRMDYDWPRSGEWRGAGAGAGSQDWRGGSQWSSSRWTEGEAWSGRAEWKSGRHSGEAWSGRQNGWEDEPQDLRIELARRDLDDEMLRAWINEEGPEVLRHLQGGGSFDSVDISGNHITDEGCRLLVKWLLECHVPVRRLKLFKNQLKCPMALCGLIEDADLGIGAAAGLQELHLSSNNITEEGVACLLDSICRRKKACVAKLDPPIWFRVERNDASLGEVASRLTEAYGARGLSICTEGGDAWSKCSIQQCVHGADVHMHLVGGNKSAPGGKGGYRRSW